MNKKQYIKPDKLLNDSLKLGMKIFKSGYKPNCIIGIWRGGAQISITIQELLEYLNIKMKNIYIGTSSYYDIEKQDSTIYIDSQINKIRNLTKEDKILIIDDVHDTGLSIQKVINHIQMYCYSIPTIKVGTIYFKSDNNKTNNVPDFYIYDTDDWLVFPHELLYLHLNEIIRNKHFDIFIKKDLINLIKSN